MKYLNRLIWLALFAFLLWIMPDIANLLVSIFEVGQQHEVMSLKVIYTICYLMISSLWIGLMALSLWMTFFIKGVDGVEK